MTLSVSALRAAFTRSGHPGAHTGLLDAAPTEIVEAVRRANSEMSDPAQPVLVSWRNASDWIAIMSTGLLVCNAGHAEHIRASDIKQITPVTFRDGRRLQKTDLTELRIDLQDGSAITVYADAGRPFSGIWNVLKALERASGA